MSFIVMSVALLGFAVLHSIFAGQFKPVFKQRVGERAFHGLYRIFYNILAVITFLPAVILMAILPANEMWSWDEQWIPILLIIQGIGVLGAGISLLQIDLFRFLGISQVLAYVNGDVLPLPAQNMQIRGLYRYMRHPLYTFSLMATWAQPVMTDVYLAFCIGVTLYFVLGSMYEEQRLVKEFGEQYISYRDSVPAFIPFMRGFKS